MAVIRTRLIVLVLVCCSFVYPGSAFALDSEQVAPDWSLDDADGKQINFYSDSEQQLSILVFWATWCPYCRSLMPHIQDILEEFNEQPLSVYALNVWEDGDPRKYFIENEFSFKLLLRADLVAEDYGVRGTPGLFLIDENRHVLYMRSSGEKDLELKANLKRLIQGYFSK